MISKESLKEFPDACIHTPTQADWDKVVKEFSLDLPALLAHGKETVVFPGDRRTRGTYADAKWARDNDKAIYQMSDINWGNSLPTGYRLIKKYPGSSDTGSIVTCQYVDGVLDTVRDSRGESFGTDWVKGEYAEFWEPIYEETLKAGDWVVVLEDYKGIPDRGLVGRTLQVADVNTGDPGWGANTDYCCRIFTEEGNRGSVVYRVRHATAVEIEKEMDRRLPRVAGYKAIVDGQVVSFGCQGFTKDQLFFLRGLINGEADAHLTIRGEDIGVDLINKVLSQFKT